jgi:ribonuclease HII
MKVSEIGDLLKGTAPEQIPELLKTFETDERTAVKTLVKRYQKKYDAYMAELSRQYEMMCYERSYGQYEYICGIDEAGRGPYAGPVVAAAVILPKGCQILYLNDSKQLNAVKREQLYDEIMEKAISVGVGIVGPDVIDEINILQADYEAMRQAVGKLSVVPQVLLNDAVTIPGLSMIQENIIHGDAKSLSIAAASVIAKVTRDRMMVMYDELYPEYGFAQNKGYGSAAHEAAIREYGLCPIHRRSFTTKFQKQEEV